MKRLGVFLLPLDGMTVHCRVTPSIKLAYLYTWVERERHCESKVLCPRTQQCPQPGLVARLLDIQRRAQQSWEPIPPTVHQSSSTKRFFWSEILCRLQSCTAKTSFASHCESLEIKFLGSKLKGRKQGNVYSLEIFSNTPTIKEVNLTEIDSFSWQNVPYGQHWSVVSHIVCLQQWCCGNNPWTVSERIFAKPKEKKCRRSFLLRTPSLAHAKESYTKAHVPRGWAHNLVGLIIIRLLCKYSGGSLYL